MGEEWLRPGLVLVAVLVAGSVVAFSRRRHSVRPRRLPATGLGAGVYLFTSNTCPECGPARSQLESSLGRGAYEEISWDTAASLFGDLGVDSVPATLIVDMAGSGVLWPGDPARAIASLGP